MIQRRILFLAGTVLIACGLYYGVLSPVMSRMPQVVREAENNIEGNRYMENVQAVIAPEYEFLIRDAIEHNSTFIGIIADRARSGWDKLSHASLFFLGTGVVIIITAATIKTSEPGGALNEGHRAPSEE